MRFAPVVVASILAALPSPAAGQPLGQVFVEVTRQSTGEPVLDLGPDAFEVSEDGREIGRTPLAQVAATVSWRRAR